MRAPFPAQQQLVCTRPRPEMVSREAFKSYYAEQMGSGSGPPIGPVFRSSFGIQRGRGIGGFIRGLWQFLKPSLLGGARKAGEQLLSTTGKLITDYSIPQNRQDAGQVFKSRAKEGWDELKQRWQQGTGRRRRARPRQVGRGLRTPQTASRRARGNTTRQRAKQLPPATRRRVAKPAKRRIKAVKDKDIL